MSEWMLWLVAALYTWSGVDLMLGNKVALGITFISYGVATVALIFVARSPQ